MGRPRRSGLASGTHSASACWYVLQAPYGAPTQYMSRLGTAVTPYGPQMAASEMVVLRGREGSVCWEDGVQGESLSAGPLDAPCPALPQFRQAVKCACKTYP